MDDREKRNPFTDSRVTIASTNCLLYHGDQNYSLFKRLKQNKRLYSSQVLGNDKEAQQNILWRYEKEYYTPDETGHSLAEQVFNRKLYDQNRQKQDFWHKISTSFNRSTKPNPFAKTETASTISISSNISMRSSGASEFDQQSVRTERQTKRLQINKLRKTINQSKKVQQTKNMEQKFSLVSMYKAKKAQESFQPASLDAGKIMQKAQPKESFQYPQTIFVREEQYFYVPLG